MRNWKYWLAITITWEVLLYGNYAVAAVTETKAFQVSVTLAEHTQALPGAQASALNQPTEVADHPNTDTVIEETFRDNEKVLLQTVVASR